MYNIIYHLLSFNVYYLLISISLEEFHKPDYFECHIFLNKNKATNYKAKRELEKHVKFVLMKDITVHII